MKKKRICDLLMPQVQSVDDWEIIDDHLKKCDACEVSAYELYLALGQENVPVPVYVIDTILQRNPNLANDQETFDMNCLLAYVSDHTSFVTLKRLLDASGRSFELSNMLLRKSLRGDFARFDMARELIRYQPDLLTYCDSSGNMPIHECCSYCESPAMVQLLIDEGNVWLPRNADGLSPIDIALESEYAEGARIILGILIHSAPEFPTKAEVLDNELLHVAARISDLYYARQILQVYPECIHALNYEKATPLHLACLHGLPSMIQFLLDQETKLKLPSVATKMCESTQFTPLQLACVNPNTNLLVMKSLLRACPEFCPLETMVWKYKLLHITAMGSNVELARYFLELFPQALAITSNTGCLPIRFSCMTGSSEMVQLLLERGMQQYDAKHGLLLYKEDLYSESTLQLACSNIRMNAKIVNRLFQCTQISTNRVLKENLLHRAVQANNLDVAKLILQRWPMSLVRKDRDMNLPLHIACSSGSTKMLRLIFTKSIKNILSKKYQNWDATISLSIFEENIHGQTPWNLLCYNFSSLLEAYGDDALITGAWPCIKLVLYLRAGVLEHHPSQGMPLLHAAIMMIEPLDVLSSIIVNRALRCDVCVIDYKGRTALHVIAKQQAYNRGMWCDIIEYLVDVERNGRKCALMKDFDGRLPIHTASYYKMHWNNGLKHIVEANITALDITDSKTGLYPFMLAASAHSRFVAANNLETIYELLRLNPAMIGDTNAPAQRSLPKTK